MPEKKSVYVVNGFYVCRVTGALGLKLVGVPVFNAVTGEEMGWNSKCFRLLDMVKMENRLAQSEDEPSRAAAERSAP